MWYFVPFKGALERYKKGTMAKFWNDYIPGLQLRDLLKTHIGNEFGLVLVAV